MSLDLLKDFFPANSCRLMEERGAFGGHYKKVPGHLYLWFFLLSQGLGHAGERAEVPCLMG